MHSVYLLSSPATRRFGAAYDCAAGDAQQLLEAVVRLSQQWLEQFHLPDAQHEKVARLGVLATDLVKRGDFSSVAMTTARALLCVNCRRLDAAQGQCHGQSLERCPLLKVAS